MCAAPKYLESVGTPQTLTDLELHNCLTAGAQDVWRLDGPEGAVTIRPKGNVRSNSADFVREALTAGLGIALRSTWDVGEELANGSLKVVLPEYRGANNDAIYAVYPSREFMPSKVNVFIDFLSELYGMTPYWEKSVDVTALLKAGGDARASNRAGGNGRLNADVNMRATAARA